MKRSAINPRGKVSKRREKNLREWRKRNPCPEVCPICGRAPDWRGMAPHHNIKRSHMGDESDGNLIWLCGVCHDATEDSGEKRKDIDERIAQYFEREIGRE